MDTYHSQDEADKVRNWLKANGPALVIGIVLGLVLLFGVNYWRDHRQTQAAQASLLYSQMLVQQQSRDPAAVKTGELLMNEFEGTPYAGKAALLLARMDMEAGDVVSARARLQWALENADEDATRHAARLRLARIMLDRGEIDPALALIAVEERDGFESQYQELRGDLLVKKGETDDARAAYRAALETLPQNSPYAAVLQMKLDDLGPEQAS